MKTFTSAGLFPGKKVCKRGSPIALTDPCFIKRYIEIILHKVKMCKSNKLQVFMPLANVAWLYVK